MNNVEFQKVLHQQYELANKKRVQSANNYGRNLQGGYSNSFKLMPAFGQNVNMFTQIKMKKRAKSKKGRSLAKNGSRNTVSYTENAARLSLKMN